MHMQVAQVSKKMQPDGSPRCQQSTLPQDLSAPKSTSDSCLVSSETAERPPPLHMREHWARLSNWRFIGHGRKTVSRVLFRKRGLTEFCAKLGEFHEKLGEFAVTHKSKAERNSLSSLTRTR